MQRQVFISYSSRDKSAADEVCRQLEHHGCRCWIAPRDISFINWTGSIMAGMRESDVFVVIASRDAMESPQVVREVTEATMQFRFLFPFRIDGEPLNDVFRYHLEPCHWIDASQPPMDAHIRELTERIVHLSEADSIYANPMRQSLRERIQLPKAEVIGREAEIAAVGERLEEHPVLFVQGMGGIGKTEIVKEYIRRNRERYKGGIAFLNYATTLEDLIGGPELQIENVHRREEEADGDWIRRKMDALRKIASDRMLIVVDGFNREQDPMLEELLNCPCRFLITSRYDPGEYPTLRIGSMADFADVRKLFQANYGRNVTSGDTEAVDGILRTVQCHTITVALMARQMKASFLKPGKMLEMLRERGLNLRLREKGRRERDGPAVPAFDFLRQMFRMSDLPEEERRLTTCFCFIPQSGIRVHLLGEILQMEDFETVNSLTGKSWLEYAEEEERLRLHAVIGDVIREELYPEQADSAEYARGLNARLTGCWFFSAQEREEIYPLLQYYLRMYPEPAAGLWQEYLDFTDHCWVCGDYSLAQQTGKKVYEYAMRRWGGGICRISLRFGVLQQRRPGRRGRLVPDGGGALGAEPGAGSLGAGEGIYPAGTVRPAAEGLCGGRGISGEGQGHL